MNIRSRKNLIYRLVSGTTLLASLVFIIFAFIWIINGNADNKVLPIIALTLTGAFTLLEGSLILYGRTKEVIIKDIVFEESGRSNNLFLITVIIGALFAISLVTICSIIFVTKEGEPYFTSSLVVLVIGLFLFVNCLIYFLYLLMFRKRKFDIKDYIK